VFFSFQLFYIVFLVMYTYIVLGRTLPTLRWQEYYVMVYIATLAIEKIRQVSESKTLKYSRSSTQVSLYDPYFVVLHILLH